MKAEKKFIDQVRSASDLKQGKISDTSGSWANVALFVDNICYVANVGDSRAILSINKGRIIKAMSIDHKPDNSKENLRIIKAGGSIYQNQNTAIVGPYRVMPGRLSVSRAFGNFEAKWRELGGNPKVLIATPDIKKFSINSDSDFLVMGSDGIFEQQTSESTISSVWSCATQNYRNQINFHRFLGETVDFVLKKSISTGTLDNITWLIIAFNDFAERCTIRQSNTTEMLSTDVTHQRKPYLGANHLHSMNTITKQIPK